MDAADCALVAFLIGVAVAIVKYGATDSSYWRASVSFSGHVLLATWLSIVLGVLVGYVAFLFPRHAVRGVSWTLRLPTTRGWRWCAAVTIPADWMIATSALGVFGLVACSRYDGGTWIVFGGCIRLMPSSETIHGIFHMTGSIFGWILGAIGATITIALFIRGFEDRWDSSWRRTTVREHVEVGASVGAAIGAYRELRKLPAQRRLVAGTMTGAAAGATVGFATGKIETLLPVLLTVGAGFVVGVLCYMVGYYVIGMPIGAVVLVLVLAWHLGVVILMLCAAFASILLALTVLRMLSRMLCAGARCMIGGHCAFPQSRTRWVAMVATFIREQFIQKLLKALSEEVD